MNPSTPDPDQHAGLPPDHRIRRSRPFLASTLRGVDDVPADLAGGDTPRAPIRRSTRSIAHERGAGE